MEAERVDAPPAPVAAAAAAAAVCGLEVAVVLVVVSLSWSCSECEDGVDGNLLLGATSVSWMPRDAACRAADLLSRYRLYSSPRTSGRDDEEDELSEDDERGAELAADWLAEAEAGTRVGERAVAGMRAVHWLPVSPLTDLLEAAMRAAATRRMYGHLLSTDAVAHAHLYEVEQVLTGPVEAAGEARDAVAPPVLFGRLPGHC